MKFLVHESVERGRREQVRAKIADAEQIATPSPKRPKRSRRFNGRVFSHRGEPTGTPATTA